MIDHEQGLFFKFIKMKPLVFEGLKFEYAFEFLIAYFEHLNKMGIIERYNVVFVFQIEKEAKHLMEVIYGVQIYLTSTYLGSILEYSPLEYVPRI